MTGSISLVLSSCNRVNGIFLGYLLIQDIAAENTFAVLSFYIKLHFKVTEDIWTIFFLYRSRANDAIFFSRAFGSVINVLVDA